MGRRYIIAGKTYPLSLNGWTEAYCAMIDLVGGLGIELTGHPEFVFYLHDRSYELPSGITVSFTKRKSAEQLYARIRIPGYMVSDALYTRIKDEKWGGDIMISSEAQVSWPGPPEVPQWYILGS